MSTTDRPLAERALSALHRLTRVLADEGPASTAWRAASADALRAALTTWLLRVVVLEIARASRLDLMVAPPAWRSRRDARHGGEPAAGAKDHGLWLELADTFRLLHAWHGGALLDPATHPILDAPLVEDGCVLEVIGELFPDESDRTPEVEDVGAVHEALLGVSIDVSDEPRIVLRAGPGKGTREGDVVVGLATLLAAPPGRRADRLVALGVPVGARAGAALATARTEGELADALRGRTSAAVPGIVAPGRPVPQATEERRRAGAHYTPRALTDVVVERTLRPLVAALGDAPEPSSILALRVADPAMGCGAFLLAALRLLGTELAEALRRAGDDGGAPARERRARTLVATHVLRGVDRDPLAVEVARTSLWLACGAPGLAIDLVAHGLRRGDAVVGVDGDVLELHPELEGAARLGRAAAVRRDLLGALDRHDVARARDLLAEIERLVAPVRAAADATIAGAVPAVAAPFHWPLEWSDVVPPLGAGFDALVGNPPWVSYAGRAAQPLDPAQRAWMSARYRSFGGFRNLQGAFVERSAELLRPSGRLGLVLPSSMSEQAGYAPARLAHDRLAACDADLLDVGEDGFEGVFQPSMVLTSTRRRDAVTALDAPWPVERPDLDRGALDLIARLTAHAPLPAALFGERGLQSSGEDLAHLAPEPRSADDVPLRAGGDIRAFFRGPPSHHAERAWFGARLRTTSAWADVRVLVRQTAAYPIATLSDGAAFRNSILAGFGDDVYPPAFLVAWLNATPIRWLHFMRHRDARQGMPQVKVGHLRAIPAPLTSAAIADLARLGEALALRNEGIRAEEQATLDLHVAASLGLDADDRERTAAWWRTVASPIR